MIPDDIFRQAEQAKDAIQNKPEQDTVDYLVYESLTALLNLARDQAERISRVLSIIEADTMSQPASLKRTRAILSDSGPEAACQPSDG